MKRFTGHLHAVPVFVAPQRRGVKSRSGGGKSGSFHLMNGLSFWSCQAFADTIASLNAFSNAAKSLASSGAFNLDQSFSTYSFSASSCLGRTKPASSNRPRVSFHCQIALSQLPAFAA